MITIKLFFSKLHNNKIHLCNFNLYSWKVFTVYAYQPLLAIIERHGESSRIRRTAQCCPYLGPVRLWVPLRSKSMCSFLLLYDCEPSSELFYKVSFCIPQHLFLLLVNWDYQEWWLIFFASRWQHAAPRSQAHRKHKYFTQNVISPLWGLAMLADQMQRTVTHSWLNLEHYFVLAVLKASFSVLFTKMFLSSRGRTQGWTRHYTLGGCEGEHGAKFKGRWEGCLLSSLTVPTCVARVKQSGSIGLHKPCQLASYPSRRMLSMLRAHLLNVLSLLSWK